MNLIDIYGTFNCSDIVFINNTVGIGYAFGVQTFTNDIIVNGILIKDLKVVFNSALLNF